MHPATWEETIAQTALPVRCQRIMPMAAPAKLTHSIVPIDGLPPNIRARIVMSQAPATAPVSCPLFAPSFFIATSARVSTHAQIIHDTGEGTVSPLKIDNTYGKKATKNKIPEITFMTSLPP